MLTKFFIEKNITEVFHSNRNRQKFCNNKELYLTVPTLLMATVKKPLAIAAQRVSIGHNGSLR